VPSMKPLNVIVKIKRQNKTVGRSGTTSSPAGFLILIDANLEQSLASAIFFSICSFDFTACHRVPIFYDI